MSVSKLIFMLLFGFFSGSAIAEECLSNGTLQQIEKAVFSNKTYKDIPVYYDDGEENLDIGYSFSKSGNLYIVKHFRPNFDFTYLVTNVDNGHLIEASFYSHGILDGDPEHMSYRVYHNSSTSKTTVLCGEENAGNITIEPIITVLPDLSE